MDNTCWQQLYVLPIEAGVQVGGKGHVTDKDKEDDFACCQLHNPTAIVA